MSTSHGHTVAAWVAVAIIMAAFIVGAAGILMSNWAVFWGSVLLAAVGAAAGKVLQSMGYGQAS